MVRSLLFLLFFSVVINAKAQHNLVPNPSFETYSSCPTGGGQIYKATGWSSYSGGPNLFVGGLGVACGPGNYSVPNNMHSDNTPAYGGGSEKAYAGIWSAKNSLFEYITAEIPALEIGSAYEVTVFVALGSKSHYATDGLGVFFSDEKFPIHGNPADVLNVTPQIDYSSYGVISNRTSWKKLTSTFVADSTYDNLIIGGFKPNADITELPVSLAPGPIKAYYFIDSVIVRKVIPTVSISAVSGSFCLGDSIKVGYTTNANFKAGNVFTLQLSDAIGNFTNPINVTTVTATSSGILQGVIPNSTAVGLGYRVRISSSDPATISAVNTADISINKAPVIEASSNSPLCAGDTLKLKVTSNDSTATYNWGGPSNVSTQQNPEIADTKTYHTGVHHVTVTVNGCIAKDSVTVVVREAPFITAHHTDTLVCAGGTLHLSAESNMPGAGFYWRGPNDFTATSAAVTLPQVTKKNNGQYKVIAIGGNGCASDTADLWTNIIDLEEEILTNANSLPGDTIKLRTPDNIPGTEYTWVGPAGFYSVDEKPDIIDVAAKNGGYYDVTLKYRSCEERSRKWIQISNRTTLTIFPNPNTGTFKVKGNILKDQVIPIEIVDASGRSLYRDSVKTVRKRFEKEISIGENLANGMYFVRFVMEDGTETIRMFIGR